MENPEGSKGRAGWEGESAARRQWATVLADATGCLAFLGKGKCRDNWAGIWVYSS